MEQNIDEIKKKAEQTKYNLNMSKKEGEKRRYIGINGLIAYCDTVIGLCDKIKELNTTIELIKDWAVINFDEELLKTIKTIQKDPTAVLNKRKNIG